METKKLDQWYVTSMGPYSPPEFGSRVVGRRECGKMVKTSRIESVEGRIVTTASDSKYELLEPCKEWINWLEENGRPLPTEEEPIRMKT